MSAIDTLFKRYDRAEGDYLANIKDKNATTFSESSIYDNDINLVKNRFDELSTSLATLIEKTRSVMPNEERFPNTCSKIQQLIKNLDGFKVYIDKIAARIHDASLEAYQEFSTEFKHLTYEYMTLTDGVDNSFQRYYSYKSEIESLETTIADKKANGFDALASAYEKKVTRLREQMNSCLNNIESSLQVIEDYNVKLKEILNSGLMKSV